LAPLPAYPLKQACEYTMKNKNNILAIKSVRDMVYLLNSDSQCHNFKKEYILCSDLTGCGDGLSALSWE